MDGKLAFIETCLLVSEKKLILSVPKTELHES